MRILFALSIVAFSVVFALSCSQGESGPKFGTGTLKQPVQNLNSTPSNKNFDVLVDLPLLLWQSFGYRRIAKDTRTKVEHCTIIESEGTQLQIGAKVEVLDEARCLYVRMVTSDGVPRSFTITIMKIRLLETGAEGWTWSKAVEFDKK